MTRPYCIESLQEKLKQLGLPFADVFARALAALLTARKISIHQITHLMPGECNAEANRQQIRRCLDHETLDESVWARAIAALLPKQPWVLAMDRTEWKRGQTTINLLVLAVVGQFRRETSCVHGCAVPLLWTVMPDCGASDTAERKALIGRFIALFGVSAVRFLTADREFIGGDWVAWLLEQRLPFRIRVKAGEFLTDETGVKRPAWEWFAKRACRCKPQTMELWGLPVFVGGKRLHEGKYLIIISNERVKDLWEDYRLRWKIETLFQGLKGRGFDMESCRLSQEKRLSGWFGFLALGFCWCLRMGHCLDELAPLPLKKHKRRAISVFARGMRQLQALLARLVGSPSAYQFGIALELLEPIK